MSKHKGEFGEAIPTNTPYEQAIQEVESLDFAVRLNVASSLTTYLNGLMNEQAVKQVKEGMASPGVWKQVVARWADLVTKPIDEQYLNPYDVALSVYTLMFYWYDAEVGRMAAEATSAVRQCWWTPRIATLILSSEVSNTANLNLVYQFKNQPEILPTKATTSEKRFNWHLPVGRDASIASRRMMPSEEQAFSPTFAIVGVWSSEQAITYGQWKEIKAA